MKKLYTLLCTVLFTVVMIAQAPQKMSYQAVIRDAGNNLIQNHAVGMRISILKGSVSPTVVYTETQTPSTNVNGLVSIEIGGTGFDAINWANDLYFIKTETDPTGGTNYTVVGTSQLLSVPYALHSKTVASYSETDPLYTAWNKSSGINITSSQVSDFQTSVTNTPAVLANTAKISYPPADAAKVALLSGTNTGDETTATIKAKLGITVLLGSNTGDQTLAGLGGVASNAPITGATKTKITYDTKGLVTTGADATTADIAASANKNYVTDAQLTVIGNTSGTNTGDNSPNTLYSGFVSNATHTGDATGATALTVVRINGTSLAGLATGILKNTNGTGVPSIAAAGTDYVAPSGTAALTGTAPVIITNSPKIVGSTAADISVAPATISVPGLMSAADKLKLDGIPTSTHWLGQFTDGGIVFNIYKGGDGLEHGLIVNVTEGSYVWSNSTAVTNATSTWDGSDNTSKISALDSPAKAYIQGLSGWYWPSIDELKILYYNRFYVNKGLEAHGDAPIQSGDYWSSTEISDVWATSLYFGNNPSNVAGAAYTGVKGNAGMIRAIKSF